MYPNTPVKGITGNARNMDYSILFYLLGQNYADQATSIKVQNVLIQLLVPHILGLKHCWWKFKIYHRGLWKYEINFFLLINVRLVKFTSWSQRSSSSGLREVEDHKENIIRYETCLSRVGGRGRGTAARIYGKELDLVDLQPPTILISVSLCFLSIILRVVHIQKVRITWLAR